jgi:DNA-binding NarL/FixJ family response regulator
MAFRVLLADDHQMFREGLRKLLEDDHRVEVVAEAANGLDALHKAAECRPDVVIMDVGMAVMNGVDSTEQIRRQGLARVIVLSIYEDEETVAQAIRAGALGYLTKASAGRELFDALDAVMRGEVYLSRGFSETLRRRLAEAPPRRRAARNPLDALTGRQRQVLQLLAEGHTNKDIARLLGLSVETVKSHRQGLAATLGVRGVAGLTKIAIEHGLIRPSKRPEKQGGHQPPPA